jgi:outer membrane biogenesis lipoprotein LolB
MLRISGLNAGGAMAEMARQSRGADNTKAKKELGWTLRYPSWRQGFVAAYGPAAPAQPGRAQARPRRPTP